MDFHIYEVSPRDGLQGMDTIVPTADKLALIDMIVGAGIKKIEVGSFVHPHFVPNMADSGVIFAETSSKYPNCELSMLIPNKRGMDRAKSRGVQKYNIFMSPSIGFTKNNHKKTPKGVFDAYLDVMDGIPKEDVRVYLSCVFGCPMDGEIEKSALIESLEWADHFGNTIVLSDTAGRATGDSIESVIQIAKDTGISADMALHLHHNGDTVPMRDKLDVAYEMGIREFDSCIMGLGGCPFVDGSGGNLSTEELVLWGMKNGLDSGIHINDLADVGDFVVRKFKERLPITA
jgi:hydroxymethylglutaryl-CoA lyase